MNCILVYTVGKLPLLKTHINSGEPPVELVIYSFVVVFLFCLTFVTYGETHDDHSSRDINYNIFYFEKKIKTFSNVISNRYLLFSHAACQIKSRFWPMFAVSEIVQTIMFFILLLKFTTVFSVPVPNMHGPRIVCQAFT